MQRLVIIGAGLAGLALAQALLQQGWLPQHIRIWEQTEVGSQASGVPGALVHPFPGRSLFPRSEYLAAWEFTQEWLRPWLEQGLVKAMPLIRPVLDEATGIRLQRSWQRGLAKGIAGPSWYDAEALATAYPETQPTLGGYVIPLAFGVDLATILTQLAVALQQQGVHIERDTSLQHLKAVSTGWCLENHHTRVNATQVVLTVGAALADFFPALPVAAIRGELLLGQPSPAINLDYAISGGGHVVPLTSQTWVVGSTFAPASEPWHPTDSQAQLLQKSATLLRPILTPQHLWSGIRAVMGQDREPVAGAIPGLPGLFVLAGLAAKGLLLAPLLADQLAQMLTNNTCHLPAYVAPTRWPEQCWQLTKNHP